MFNESIFTEQLSVFGYAACHLLPELTRQRSESWWTLAAHSMLQHDGWRATRLLARLENKSEFIIALSLTRILLPMASVLQGGCSTRIIHMMILITRILLPTWRPTTSCSWGLGHLWDYHDILGGYTSHTCWEFCFKIARQEGYLYWIDGLSWTESMQKSRDEDKCWRTAGTVLHVLFCTMLTRLWVIQDKVQGLNHHCSGFVFYFCLMGGDKDSLLKRFPAWSHV